jgi:hypothetical protein
VVVAAMLAGVLLGRVSAPAGAPSLALPSRAVAVAVGDSPGMCATRRGTTVWR